MTISKIKRAILIAVIAIAGGLGFMSANSDSDFKVVKNLDLFFSVFRELKLFYVDDIDPDELVRAGIDGMLAKLDPYTEFMSEDEAKEFDVATTGEYGGIGSLIRQAGDYTEISEVYEGLPADKAGLIAGDLILAIDGVSLKGKTSSDASTLLKGNNGTAVQLKVLKVKTKDTVNIKVAREKIHLSSIPYSTVFDNGVGYIRLTSFTRDCHKDFRKALVDLKKNEKMKSLIIDLRGNGGGSLDDAVKILNFFVPKGTEVVSSRGRIKEFDYVYRTEDEPIDTSIPLAVLVNSGSASTSEIVAGAIQDFDRGIIIGTRTFGKGLVQAVRPLNYNTRLKITTAKYYTPSGRCVQAHNFSKRNEDGSVAFIPDSLKKEFNTKIGRKVYDGGGILPDIQDSLEVYSKITTSLLLRGLISDYSVQYYCNHATVAPPETFHLNDADYTEFVTFLENKDYDYETRSENLLKQLKDAVKKDKYSEVVERELDSLTIKLAHNKNKDLQIFKPEISRLIEEEIAVRYYYQKGRMRAILRDDSQMKAASEILLNTERYKEILSAPKE